MRKYRVLPVLLVALDAIQAKREPIRKRKIDSFVEVELWQRSVKCKTFHSVGAKPYMVRELTP